MIIENTKTAPAGLSIIKNLNIETSKPILIKSIGYLEMIWLLQRIGLVLTDSSRTQKETFFFNKACVTIHD